MKGKSLQFLNTWRFWLSFQGLLWLGLYIIGNIRAENSFQQLMHRPGEAFLMNVVGTILGFPSGIFFFFVKRWNDLGEIGFLKFFFFSFSPFLVAGVYYSLFIILVRHITRKKVNWKWVAGALILFMLLNFGGCARVIDLQLVIT